MFSRRFSLLIVAAYLIGQFAAVPHVHGDQPADHASIRHVHLPMTGAHAHGQHGHIHRHDGLQSPESTPADHDHGCIHLAGGSMESTPERGLLVVAMDVSFLAVDGTAPVLADINNRVESTITPPDILRSGRDLCLTLRTWRN